MTSADPRGVHMADDIATLMAELAAARTERQAALDQREWLALDNLLLARRTAEAERQLEQARATAMGLPGLLGWQSASPSMDTEMAAELEARATENVQLQYALFEMQRDHKRMRNEEGQRHAVCVAVLCQALVEAEAIIERQGTMAAAAASAALVAEQEREEQHARMDAMHVLCQELKRQCATAIDEVESSAQVVARLKERELVHRRWRTKLQHAWRLEQDRAIAAEEARQQEAVVAAMHAVRAAAANDAQGRNAESCQEPFDEPSPSAAPATLESEEPDWLSAAAEAMTNLSPSSVGDGGACSAVGGYEAEGTNSTPSEASVLDLRAALAEEKAARGEAEARAQAANEELAISSQRFQQQIALLSDALADLQAKDTERRRRQQARGQRTRGELAGAHQHTTHSTADAVIAPEAITGLAYANVGVRGFASWAVGTVGSVGSAAVDTVAGTAEAMAGVSAAPLRALEGLGESMAMRKR